MPTIGFFGRELTSRYPRGMERLGRAVAERLVCDPSFHCVNLESILLDQRTPTFVSSPLKGWLDSHPLHNVYLGWDAGITAAALQVLPPLSIPLVARVYGSLKQMLQRRIGSAAPASSSSEPSSNRYIGINELDFCVTFDPENPLIRLDWENASTRLITIIHDTIPLRIFEGPTWKPIKFRTAISTVVLRSHKLMCVSQSTERDLHYFFPHSRGKTIVASPSSNLRDPRPASAAGLKSVVQRHIPGLNPDVPYFVFIGALERRKNLSNLLRACRWLARESEVPKFQLVLAGTATYLRNFRHLIDSVRNRVPVHIAGYLNDEAIPELIGNATALVMPSLWEGFGIPLVEAMQLGTLVVTSDISSLPEVAGDVGIYCDPYDHRSIAKALKLALTLSPEDRQVRIEAGKRRAAEFSYERFVGTLRKLIAEA